MKVREFLEGVWAEQEPGYTFTPYKDSEGGWHEVAHAPSTLKLPTGGKADVYFCPNTFGSASRRTGNVQAGRWLYADLDEVDPRDADPRPSVAWESSPGRFQALWRLSRSAPPKTIQDLNRRLTYALSADRSGWDLTQVLRVPGTRNHKYAGAPRVRLLWWEKRTYKVADLRALLKEAGVGPQGKDDPLKLPGLSARELFAKHKARIGGRARRLLLEREVQQGERSDRLWELEHLLLDVGIEPEEVLVLVRESAWNKYRGRPDELKRLWLEIQKAVRSKTTLEVTEGKKPTFQLSPSGWEHHDFFMEHELKPPGWMVENIWSASSHGILAGEPKAYKSLLATELAVSVASGTPFLGRYAVPDPGPVLIIQEENSPWLMQDRLFKIEHAHGLLPEAHMVSARMLQLKSGGTVELELLNNAGFDLTDPSHLELLERKVQVVRPKLVILDPLYLMLGSADERVSREIRPILQWLLHLRYQYEVGVLIVHHYSKSSAEEGRQDGQRILGSQAFHGWVESALYVEKGKEPGVVKVAREFRNYPPRPALTLMVNMGEPGSLDMGIDVRTKAHTRVVDLVNAYPGITVAEVAQQMKVDPRVVRKEARAAGLKTVPGKSTGGRPPVRLFASKRNGQKSSKTTLRKVVKN